MGLPTYRATCRHPAPPGMGLLLGCIAVCLTHVTLRLPLPTLLPGLCHPTGFCCSAACCLDFSARYLPAATHCTTCVALATACWDCLLPCLGWVATFSAHLHATPCLPAVHTARMPACTTYATPAATACGSAVLRYAAAPLLRLCTAALHRTGLPGHTPAVTATYQFCRFRLLHDTYTGSHCLPACHRHTGHYLRFSATTDRRYRNLHCRVTTWVTACFLPACGWVLLPLHHCYLRSPRMPAGWMRTSYGYLPALPAHVLPPATAPPAILAPACCCRHHYLPYPLHTSCSCLLDTATSYLDAYTWVACTACHLGLLPPLHCPPHTCACHRVAHCYPWRILLPPAVSADHASCHLLHLGCHHRLDLFACHLHCHLPFSQFCLCLRRYTHCIPATCEVLPAPGSGITGTWITLPFTWMPPAPPGSACRCWLPACRSAPAAPAGCSAGPATAPACHRRLPPPPHLHTCYRACTVRLLHVSLPGLRITAPVHCLHHHRDWMPGLYCYHHLPLHLPLPCCYGSTLPTCLFAACLPAPRIAACLPPPPACHGHLPAPACIHAPAPPACVLLHHLGPVGSRYARVLKLCCITLLHAFTACILLRYTTPYTTTTFRITHLHTCWVCDTLHLRYLEVQRGEHHRRRARTCHRRTPPHLPPPPAPPHCALPACATATRPADTAITHLPHAHYTTVSLRYCHYAILVDGVLPWMVHWTIRYRTQFTHLRSTLVPRVHLHGPPHTGPTCALPTCLPVRFTGGLPPPAAPATGLPPACLDPCCHLPGITLGFTPPATAPAYHCHHTGTGGNSAHTTTCTPTHACSIHYHLSPATCRPSWMPGFWSTGGPHGRSPLHCTWIRCHCYHHCYWITAWVWSACLQEPYRSTIQLFLITVITTLPPHCSSGLPATTTVDLHRWLFYIRWVTHLGVQMGLLPLFRLLRLYLQITCYTCPTAATRSHLHWDSTTVTATTRIPRTTTPPLPGFHLEEGHLPLRYHSADYWVTTYPCGLHHCRVLEGHLPPPATTYLPLPLPHYCILHHCLGATAPPATDYHWEVRFTWVRFFVSAAYLLPGSTYLPRHLPADTDCCLHADATRTAYHGSTTCAGLVLPRTRFTHYHGIHLLLLFYLPHTCAPTTDAATHFARHTALECCCADGYLPRLLRLPFSATAAHHQFLDYCTASPLLLPPPPRTYHCTCSRHTAPADSCACLRHSNNNAFRALLRVHGPRAAICAVTTSPANLVHIVRYTAYLASTFTGAINALRRNHNIDVAPYLPLLYIAPAARLYISPPGLTPRYFSASPFSPPLPALAAMLATAALFSLPLLCSQFTATTAPCTALLKLRRRANNNAA